MKIWYLQINRVCNHNCIFCSNPENGKMLDINQVRKKLKNLKKNNYKEVILTWGEPTLHPDLFKIIKICDKFWIKPRLITNWSKLANSNFVEKISNSSTTLVNLSVYTHKRNLNNKLRRKNKAFKKMIKALKNLNKYNVPTQITTVISRQNQDHLYETLLFIKKISPNINHFVWNVLDPLMMEQNQKTLNSIPNLNKLEKTINKCLNYLSNINNTFRIERIPLCLIPWYERANTECRKLVKKENRKVFFLDSRQAHEQKANWFRHDYKKKCKECNLYDICSGVYKMEEYYQNVKLTPQKSTKQKEAIKTKILN